MRAAPWLAVLVAGVAAAQTPPPRRAFVKLPLAEYLQLVERAAAHDRARALPAPASERPLAELVSQRNRIVLEERTARVLSTYEVELRGQPTSPVALSFTGHAETARVTPAGSATVAIEGGLLRLVAPAPGRYRVEVVGVAGMQVEGGVSRLAMAPVEAPVATTEVELPAGLVWSCGGATVASDEVRGERRVVQLALRRGVPHAFEARREVKGEEQARTLARAVVVTLVSLRPEGARRHDVVLYEVARGAVGSFEVGVPVGWEVDRLGSDEGELPPVVDGERVVVQRATQLTGTGWLAMTGPSQGWGAVSLVPVEPGVEVRARYVAVAATVAAEVEPEPRGGWQRVDLEDLPEAVRVAADGMRLAAAWQSVGDGKEGRLAVEVLPAAGVRETVVGSRETTTLVTKEGTVLHRERLVLARAGSGVEVRLGSGATLWSASVGGQAVRHLERDGLVVVPVALGTAAGTEVEVVVVERQAIGEGRTRVGITLPELMAPVLEHRWRLLLPEEHRYRFAGGSLAPVSEASGVVRETYVETLAAGGSGQISGRVTDDSKEVLPGVTVTATSRAGSRSATTTVNGDYVIAQLPPGDYAVRFELPGFNTMEASVRVNSGFAVSLNGVMPMATVAEEVTVTGSYETISTSSQASTTITHDMFLGRTPSHNVSAPSPRKEKKVEQVARTEFGGELANLRQGLVGGVRPVPVAIPSSGKSLLMAGALPPATVRVELDVKRKR